MYLSKLGFNQNQIILKSLLLSKYLHSNIYRFPKLKIIKIIFPIFDSTELSKSRLLINILDFLEDFIGCKSIITHAKVLIKKGTFFRCQIILSKFNYIKFLSFFNDYILTNSLLKFSKKPIKLNKINNNSLLLILSDLKIFFDVSTRKLLPNSKFFWLELEFLFTKPHFFINSNIKLYSQLFFCHNIFEWFLK